MGASAMGADTTIQHWKEGSDMGQAWGPHCPGWWAPCPASKLVPVPCEPAREVRVHATDPAMCSPSLDHPNWTWQWPVGLHGGKHTSQQGLCHVGHSVAVLQGCELSKLTKGR